MDSTAYATLDRLEDVIWISNLKFSVLFWSKLQPPRILKIFGVHLIRRLLGQFEALGSSAKLDLRQVFHPVSGELLE